MHACACVGVCWGSEAKESEFLSLVGICYYTVNVDDYTEPMTTFTAWVKIWENSARVAGLGEFFVQRRID